MDSDRREVVFVFGAGASADLNVPTLASFSGRVEDIARRREIVQQQDVADGFAELIQWFNSPQRPPGDWFDPINVEHVFSLWQMEKEIGKPGASQRLSRLINTIAYTVEQSLEPGDLAWWDREPLTSGYMLLLDGLLQQCYSEWKSGLGLPFTMLTLNYDLALETAWQSTLWRDRGGELRATIYSDFHDSQYISLPYDKRRQIKHILNQCGVPVLAYASYGLIGRSRAGLRLYPLILKLHGSINWGECPVCGNVQIIKVLHGRSQPSPRVLDTLLETPCPWHPESGWSNSKSPYYRPLLVPPTWSKSGQCASLQDVWRQATQVIASAKRVVFIGYSMPETDVHIKYLLSAGMVGRTEMPDFLIVSPECEDSDFRARYSRALGTEDVTYANKCFAEAVSEILDFVADVRA